MTVSDTPATAATAPVQAISIKLSDGTVCQMTPGQPLSLYNNRKSSTLIANENTQKKTSITAENSGETTYQAHATGVAIIYRDDFKHIIGLADTLIGNPAAPAAGLAAMGVHHCTKNVGLLTIPDLTTIFQAAKKR